MFPQPTIALWKVHPGDLLGEPIQFVTHGPVTHAGFILSDGVNVAEAYLPNVRLRPLLDAEKPDILTFQLEGMSPELAEKLERGLRIACDPKFAAEYSIKGLFGFVLNIPPADMFHLFCSEWVMQMIKRITPELLPLSRCEDYQISPRDLLISPRLTEA